MNRPAVNRPDVAKDRGVPQRAVTGGETALRLAQAPEKGVGGAADLEVEPAAAAGSVPVDPAEVVSWYRDHARPLPWRESGTSAYGVLVSEVMSQQTPVTRVEPAWREWMRRWPDPAALARASASEVLLVWGRLGYPRRALRLIEAAQQIVERFGGVLPQTREELESLPGVGAYTAGAVLAFAYGRRALALDTNVRRVLARAVGGQALPAPSLTVAERRRAERLLPPEVTGGAEASDDVDPATWMVAVMELGALVCTARSPRCQECPWSGKCAWLAAGQPPDIHAARRRTQAWSGTDRQARGLVMAALRAAGPSVPVLVSDLVAQARRAGGDTDQPRRALAGLVADGLVVSDDGGASYRLP